MRSAALVAIAGALMSGCIEESDPATDAAANEGAAVTTPAAGVDSTARSTTVTASLSEWTVTLSADTVPHGTVSFEVRNTGTEDHALEVEGEGQEWKTGPIKPGESATLSVALPAGTYDVYCPLASGGEAHADRGMKTSVTVR
jgi:uncharacterized cupredoxin-like copper-binding protein